MGSTNVFSAVPAGEEDHPHIHGEHNLETQRDIDHKGSPPYTWGAR